MIKNIWKCHFYQLYLWHRNEIYVKPINFKNYE